MEWIEITAKTVEGAVELALDSLGVHESELEYEVVEQPKSGFLGIGRSQARIRARVRPISREKPQDRRRRKRGDQKRSGGGSGGRSSGERSGSRGSKSDGERTAGGGAKGGAGRGAGGGTASNGRATPRDHDDTEVDGTDVDGGAERRSSEGRPEGSGGSRSRSRNRRRRKPSGAGGANGAAESSADADDQIDAPAEDRSSGAPTRSTRSSQPRSEDRPQRARSNNQGDLEMAEATISVDEQMAEATTFTVGLLEAFGVEARVGSRIEDDDIQVDIEGEGLGVLVGPKGATLSAVEELVRTAVLVRAGGFGARIHVDVAGYRRKRREALAGFATKLAADVVSSGVAKALEPMSAADRKVVHDTVADIDGVATTSEGEEPRRRVVIRPA